MALTPHPSWSRGEFTCGACGGTFTKGRPDAEALAESRALFGDPPAEELAVVCEDCHAAMVAARPPDQFTTSTGWTGPPPKPDQLLADLLALKDRLVRETGRCGPPGPDAVVVLQDQAEGLRLFLGGGDVLVKPFLGGTLAGIDFYSVRTPEDALRLVAALDAKGKRVQLVGRLAGMPDRPDPVPDVVARGG